MNKRIRRIIESTRPNELWLGLDIALIYFSARHDAWSFVVFWMLFGLMDLSFVWRKHFPHTRLGR